MVQIDKSLRTIERIFGSIEILEHAQAVEVFHETHN